MKKINCWEFKKCGREPGGVNASKLGVCPAATETRADGMNRGTNGGRVCWGIAGTFCGGEAKGSVATKIKTCLECEFYRLVREEESLYFADSRRIAGVAAVRLADGDAARSLDCRIPAALPRLVVERGGVVAGSLT